MWRRAFPVALGVCAALASTGCYTYSALVPDRPAPGTQLEITLNDRGRVSLEGSIGPEIWQLQGRVTSVEDSGMTISISRVITIEKQITHWAGETVNVRTDYIRSLRERRFSTSRTVALAGTATAGVVAFLATRSLLGFGFEGSGPSDGGGPPSGN